MPSTGVVQGLVKADLDPLQRDVVEAREIFDRILSVGSISVDNAKITQRSEDHLSGDVVLYETDEHRQCFLVGDFTGHGLCAALGTLFASQIFRTMVQKGFPTSLIARELDAKTESLLPTGRFLAVALIAYDPRACAVEVWNAALPDVLLWRPGKGVVAQVSSQHPPLGILGGTEKAQPVRLEMFPGDRLLAMSDGLLELLDNQGQVVPRTWLEEILDEREREGCLTEPIVERFDRLEVASNDDISLLELSGVPPPPRVVGSTVPGRAVMPWRLSLEMGPAELSRGVSPIPTLMGGLDHVEGMTENAKAGLSMIVSELFVNALDHGLLRLRSELKNGPDGFTRYYHHRQEALGVLRDGFVQVSLVSMAEGVMKIEVKHDGEGISPELAVLGLTNNTMSHGRGLALVRSIAKSLEYGDEGRAALCIFEWDTAARPG